MTELFGNLALAVVCVLLVIGFCQQFRVLSAKGRLLDNLAIVPQWKFFGQSRIGGDITVFDDLHLLVRKSDGVSAPGEWDEILLWTERPASAVLWNPQLKRESAIAVHVLNLLLAERDLARRAEPTAICYLAVLRHCLAQASLSSDQMLQFAVVTTRGRQDRVVALDVLSAWHTP
jgi:hypothetical protein